jgi:hypothetical protein
MSTQKKKKMLSNEEISERNGLLINFITALDMGIHVIDLPHKPKLLII